MEKILTKKSFPAWVKKLQSYTVYAPEKQENLWSYEVIQNPDKLNLEHLNTVQAPKKITFPQREVFLQFNTSKEGKPQIKEVLPKEQPTVIFGVRPCDAKAITLTDKVFGEEPKDPYYWSRRNQTTLVGLTCNTPPSDNCFCLSVGGSPHAKEGLDILMTDMDDKYHLDSLSKKGEKLIKAAENLFKPVSPKEKKELEKIHRESEKKIKREVKDIKNIPDKLKNMFNSPFWDEEAMSCIRCGICTYLCPTCYCFDITDELTSTLPLNGKRVRTWDTCQFPDFTMHSSGHNPRPDKASRLRQRILHKFQYHVENYQDYLCTGCGRCISLCPMGIDIIEILNKVRDHE